MPAELSNLSHDGAIAAFVTLLAAFQHAVVYAGFPERLEVEGRDATAQFDALAEKLIRVTEAHQMEGAEKSDEAKGIEMATSIIKQVLTDIRQGFCGSNGATASPSTS